MITLFEAINQLPPRQQRGLKLRLAEVPNDLGPLEEYFKLKQQALENGDSAGFASVLKQERVFIESLLAKLE